MASLRNKKAAQPEKIEPAAPNLSEANTALRRLRPNRNWRRPSSYCKGKSLRCVAPRIAMVSRMRSRPADDRRQHGSQSNPFAQQHAELLNDLHSDALQAGLVDAGELYFEFMENRASELNAPAAAANRIVADMKQRSEPTPAQRQQEGTPNMSHYVSAPVSRNGPGLSGARRGRVDLSLAQREAAKMAGISETEYAKQLERFNEMYANGEIQR